MKKMDRLIQFLRIRKALSLIPPLSDILDIGCADGALFKLASNKLHYGLGVDPSISEEVFFPNYRLIPGFFPDNIPFGMQFDVITILAVFEHLTNESQLKLAEDLPKYLRANGKVIMTVPSAKVDLILKWLKALSLIDGMALEEHHEFEVEKVNAIMTKGLQLSLIKKFQFGLNNLFVFTRII
jgi:SAM-dependent methyltransferase